MRIGSAGGAVSDIVTRLLRRRASPPSSRAPSVTVDDALESWVDSALGLAGRLGSGGRLVLAALGETLVDGGPSYWFGYEPTTDGLAALLTAVGEDPAVAREVCEREVDMAGRRLGVVSEDSRARWSAFVADAVRDPEAAALLPERDPLHREAEDVWRRAAASVQPWRAVQLAPDRALGQVRWYPGCPTRAFVGYSDPLNLAAVQRAVREQRGTDEEWQALLPAQEVADQEVDPLAWRLSSLAFAVSAPPGGSHP